MRENISDALVRLYAAATKGGLLDRPRPRRAYESVYLTYKRFLEAGPVDSMRGLVTPGSTVVDVGANIGFFSLRFASWVGQTGRVIAIEPETRNIASLRRRVDRAGQSDVVTCVQAAAADRSGEVRLALNPGHPGDHHLSDDGEPVAAVTLDELAADDPRRVTLIKIDVQGAESMVLAGARRVIAQHRPAIFVEVHDPSLTRLGSSRRELITTLAGLGYAGHRLTRTGVGAREAPEELIRRSAVGYIDVLFLPMAPSSPTGQSDVGEHRQ
jgi:FkbM family methyltransferase